jgi:CRP-like cAMP-binding protein
MEFNIGKYHLKSISLFIKGKLTRKEYLKGEILFKEKSYSKGIYILRKGKIKIYQTNHDGKQSIVYIYKKGDYFGYRPLLAEEPNPVTAMALDNCVVSFITKEVFLKVLSKSPSKEFSVWINKMTIFSQYGVKERVALSLLILNQVYNRSEDETKSAVITINRDDFSGFVGTAKETLVRMLRFFKDEKIIETKGTKIIILKYQALLNTVSEM